MSCGAESTSPRPSTTLSEQAAPRAAPSEKRHGATSSGCADEAPERPRSDVVADRDVPPWKRSLRPDANAEWERGDGRLSSGYSDRNRSGGGASRSGAGVGGSSGYRQRDFQRDRHGDRELDWESLGKRRGGDTRPQGEGRNAPSRERPHSRGTPNCESRDRSCPEPGTRSDLRDSSPRDGATSVNNSNGAHGGNSLINSGRVSSSNNSQQNSDREGGAGAGVRPDKELRDGDAAIPWRRNKIQHPHSASPIDLHSSSPVHSAPMNRGASGGGGRSLPMEHHGSQTYSRATPQDYRSHGVAPPSVGMFSTPPLSVYSPASPSYPQGSNCPQSINYGGYGRSGGYSPGMLGSYGGMPNTPHSPYAPYGGYQMHYYGGGPGGYFGRMGMQAPPGGGALVMPPYAAANSAYHISSNRPMGAGGYPMDMMVMNNSPSSRPRGYASHFVEGNNAMAGEGEGKMPYKAIPDPPCVINSNHLHKPDVNAPVGVEIKPNAQCVALNAAATVEVQQQQQEAVEEVDDDDGWGDDDDGFGGGVSMIDINEIKNKSVALSAGNLNPSTTLGKTVSHGNQLQSCEVPNEADSSEKESKEANESADSSPTSSTNSNATPSTTAESPATLEFHEKPEESSFNGACAPPVSAGNEVCASNATGVAVMSEVDEDTKALEGSAVVAEGESPITGQPTNSEDDSNKRDGDEPTKAEGESSEAAQPTGTSGIEFKSLSDGGRADEDNSTATTGEPVASSAAPSTVAAPKLSGIAWRPTKRNLTRRENLDRQVKSLLNKLTIEKFPLITEKLAMLELDLKDETELQDMVNLVMDKAVLEPDWSEMYADLCQVLKWRSPDLGNDTKQTVFARALLIKIQEEYEHMPRSLELSPEESKALDDHEKVLKITKMKNRILGVVKLIGELFQRQMLVFRVVNAVVMDLVVNKEQPDEHFIECFCQLITTTGYFIDQAERNKPMLDSWFGRLKELQLKKCYSKRLYCVIQDVLDLRRAGWRKKIHKERAKALNDLREQLEHEEILGGAIHAAQYGNIVVVGQRSNLTSEGAYSEYLKAEEARFAVRLAASK